MNKVSGCLPRTLENELITLASSLNVCDNGYYRSKVPIILDAVEALNRYKGSDQNLEDFRKHLEENRKRVDEYKANKWRWW